jgi:putative NADH-flavin reductase
MKIAVIGSTGMVGSAVVKELSNRGHKVVAIARKPEKVLRNENVIVDKTDVFDTDFSEHLKGFDAVVSAFSTGNWADGELFTKGANAIINAAEEAQVSYILIVGGAGSLYVAPGVQLCDVPQFPVSVFPVANAARNLLNNLRARNNVNWSFICPPASFAGGKISYERSGKYRIGKNDVMLDSNGNPADISVADMAVAIADDVENKAHLKERFTVASV